MRMAGRMGWLAALLAALAVGAGCSSDDGGAAFGLASLEGAWFGPGDDVLGIPGTVSAAFDDAGGFMGSTTFGGAFAGTAGYEGNQVFSFLLSDGTDGGFLADGIPDHAGFVDEDFTFGVVQRGAIFLPFYYAIDLVGNWSGITVETDFIDFTTAASSVTVAADLTFSGSTDGAAFAGTYVAYSAGFGIYAFLGTGSFGQEVGQTYLTPDKRVLAGWACMSGGSFPGDCRFTVWTRQ